MRSRQIQFILEWKEPFPEFVTTCRFAVAVDGNHIWPVYGEDQDIEVFADDILAYLIEFWKPLLLRQVYPLPNQPDRPSDLRRVAERRWADQPIVVREREEDRVNAFEEAHNLASCIAGVFGLPPFWMVRSGNELVCDTQGRLHHISFSTAQAALNELGNRITARLARSGNPDWVDAIEAWKNRNVADAANLVSWSASLSAEAAKNLIDKQLLIPPTSVTEAANDNDELRIAARMAGALSASQISNIVAAAKKFERSDAPELDRLALAVLEMLDTKFGDQPPFAQGEAAGAFVRDRYLQASVQRVDIFQLVRELGIVTKLEEIDAPNAFGIAVWGPTHGPGALINRDIAKYTQNPEQNGLVRVTLAHELCHLLVDKTHAVSAVDVLNSRMSPDAERRAKSFAGELLLPGRIAADRWAASGRPRTVSEIKTLVAQLARRFGVTNSVASWKLDHGLKKIGVDLRDVLDWAFPQR